MSLRELDASVLEKMLIERVDSLPQVGDVVAYLDILVEITSINTALYAKMEEEEDE